METFNVLVRAVNGGRGITLTHSQALALATLITSMDQEIGRLKTFEEVEADVDSNQESFGFPGEESGVDASVEVEES